MKHATIVDCRRGALVLIFIGALGALPALARRAAAQDISTPTVVQLPTFSFFSVSTTVSVPDAGDGILGARHRSSQSRRRFGPGSRLSPRAIGGGFAASSARVQGVIHDLQALDDETLAKAPCPPRLSALESSSSSLPRVAANVAAENPSAASTAERPRGSVAEARARYAADVAKANGELLAVFARASNSESNGNLLAARARYRQVANRARGDLRNKALAKLRELQTADAAKKPAPRGVPDR